MRRRILPLLFSILILITVSCSKDENQAVPAYSVSFQSKTSANFIQQITFTQSKGVKSTIYNLPGTWNSSASSEFTAGDSVFIEVKTMPTTKSAGKDTLFLSIKTLNPDSSNNVKFVSSTIKNADGGMNSSLGLKLK